jgi:hypothetical protein
VITVDILELRIEEKSDQYVKRNQKAPNGHCVNIGARVMAHCRVRRIQMWERAGLR